MTPKELRYVLAIQEHQNLSKAAQSLYLSQPALSKYIKNLEASLDVKNFKNVGKRLMLTAVHKNTVFKLGCGLFLDACREVARNYPDITLETVVVDTFAMKMLMDPQDYDVVVTTNMFGDIPSDEAAELVGGLGMAAGLCVGPDYRMAQATHGSAPDIAGKGIANPFAMIMSAQMMLSWLGEKKRDPQAVQAAREIQEAAEAVLDDKSAVTPDLDGTAGTAEMGRAIRRLLA